MNLLRMERRPKVAAANYRRLVKLATKQLGLAQTYLDDGAPLDAARCAVDAAAALFQVHQVKTHMLKVMEQDQAASC